RDGGDPARPLWRQRQGEQCPRAFRPAGNRRRAGGRREPQFGGIHENRDGSMTAKRVTETFTRMAQIMTPTDANVLGNVFGGSILSLIDLTASVTSQKSSGHVCVTASFDRVEFHEPIEVGELVELEGVVTYAGRTSVEVTIQVYATTLTEGERRH